MEWLSNLASQIATGAALFIIVLYWFVRYAAEDGLIYSIVFFSIGGLFVVFAPNLGRGKRRD